MTHLAVQPAVPWVRAYGLWNPAALPREPVRVGARQRDLFWQRADGTIRNAEDLLRWCRDAGNTLPTLGNVVATCGTDHMFVARKEGIPHTGIIQELRPSGFSDAAFVPLGYQPLAWKLGSVFFTLAGCMQFPEGLIPSPLPRTTNLQRWGEFFARRMQWLIAVGNSLAFQLELEAEGLGLFDPRQARRMTFLSPSQVRAFRELRAGGLEHMVRSRPTFPDIIEIGVHQARTYLGVSGVPAITEIVDSSAPLPRWIASALDAKCDQGTN